MAISGNNDVLRDTSHVMDSKSYSNAVGNYKGETAKQGWFESDKKYDERTVAGKFELSGKAGITSNFYNAFSTAFDTYKGVIEKDLKELEENPNIKQAFSGTDIEKSIKRLITAVKAEAEDYLFKLERAEKTVIHGVELAFKKQQESLGSSMNKDTSKLEAGNSTAQERNILTRNDNLWSGQTNTGSSGGGNVSTPGGRPRNYVSQSTL